MSAAETSLGDRPRFANRLLAWFVVVVLVIAASVLVVVRAALLLAEAERVDDALDQEVGEMARLAEHGIDPATGDPFGQDVRRVFEIFLERNVPAEHETILTLIDGAPFARSLVAAPRRLDTDEGFVRAVAAVREPTRATWSTDRGQVDYVAIPITGTADGEPATGTFVVAYFSDLARADTDRTLLVVSGAVVIAAVLFAGAFARWLSRQLSRPLTVMADTAGGLDPRDLSARIAVPRDRELATLATTINGMLDRMQQLVEAQARFLADAGHELRTPITIVSGHLDVLDDDPEDRAQTIEVLQDELTRMARIVGDLSTLAKAEQPDFLTLAPVSPTRLAERIQHVISRIADRSWSVDLRGPAVDVPVDADEERLVQAVVALAENAARHTEPGDVIRVLVDAGVRELRLTVADEGPGVAPEVRDRIFDRFTRHGPRGGGAGLGLSIVQSIAEGHGGHADVRSDPGQGAAFTITIPRHQPAEPT